MRSRLGVERRAQRGRSKCAEALVEQLGLDALLDELRESTRRSASPSRACGDLLAQHLLADRVQQQARGDVAVGRVLLDQRARRRIGDLCTSSIGTPSYRFFSVSPEDRVGSTPRRRGPRRRPRSGLRSAVDVERTRSAVLDHVQHRLRGRGLSSARLLRARAARAPRGRARRRGRPRARPSASARARPGPGCPRCGRCRRCGWRRISALTTPVGQLRHQLADARRRRALAAVRRRGTPWSSRPRSCPARSRPPRRCGE